MISANFYPTLQTYTDSGIERTDVINNLYDTGDVGSPYYLGYIDHDDFPNSFGVQLVDYSQGMVFNQIESNHSWGYCFNKNVYNSSVGTTPYLAIIQDDNGYAEQGGDRYCFLNKIKMAQYNSVNTVTFSLRFMYVPTADIDESGTTYFNQGYSFARDYVTATIEQIKSMIDGTANIRDSWTSNNFTYPALKYSDFNEYGLALIQSTDSTMTVAICISSVNIGDSGLYSYGESNNVISAVFPFFEHDYDDKHILASQGTGYTEDPTIAWYQSLGIIRPHTNFGMTYNDQLYMFAPYPYDILVSDLPTYNLYQRSGLVKGQYFLRFYAVYSGYVAFYAYAHYDLKDIYTMMLYYHKIYTDTVVFSKSYTTDISVATFNDHDGATGNRLSDDYINIADQLRDWQQPDTDIAVNEYDPTDKPEYDPSGPGGDSDEGSIPLNTPGVLGATNAFVTRYVLNTTEIRAIGRRLWSTIGDGNELTWQNFFLTLSGSDKIDYSLTLSEVISYFVSLKYFPFNLSSVSQSTGENGIRVGTGASLIISGSTTKTLKDSIVQLDGGRCTIPDKWNNYLDLEPYVTASLYIPYCGTTELPMSVIAGETIGITYLVDMTTGAMTAAVMKYSGSGAYFPIAVMNGSCGFDILMTGTNGNSQMTNAITNLASKSTQWVGQILQSGLTGLMGGVSGRDTSGMGALSGMANTVMGIGQDMIQQNIQMPKLYATAPMTSGSSSSLSSLILPQTAYVQIRRHNPYRLSGSSSYQDELGLIGYRSAYQGLISSANGMGFVKCQNPNLAEVADAGATEAEINMIKSLLSDGIFT